MPKVIKKLGQSSKITDDRKFKEVYRISSTELPMAETIFTETIATFPARTAETMANANAQT